MKNAYFFSLSLTLWCIYIYGSLPIRRGEGFLTKWSEYAHARLTAPWIFRGDVSSCMSSALECVFREYGSCVAHAAVCGVWCRYMYMLWSVHAYMYTLTSARENGRGIADNNTRAHEKIGLK